MCVCVCDWTIDFCFDFNILTRDNNQQGIRIADALLTTNNKQHEWGVAEVGGL